MASGTTEDFSPPHTIELSFFSKRNNKTTQLINNSDPAKQIAGKNQWYDYVFEEPVFLTSIKVKCENYDNWDKFEVRVNHIDGTTHEEKIAVSGNAVELELGKLASGFSFKPEKKWFSKAKLLSVEVSGYTLTEFHAFEWALRKHEQEKADLQKRKNALDAKQERLEQLKNQKTSLETEVGKARAESESLTKRNEELNLSLSKRESRLADVESEIKSREQRQRALQGDIEEKKQELDEMVREVRLFPSEITGYVKEGNRSTFWYILLSIPFVTILIIVTSSLFMSAVDLTQIWKEEEDVSVWTIFLTRLPFVLVALAIIEACGYIVGRFIYEIVRINRQRIEFAKLSILAKDISAASAISTGLDDDQIFEKETKLKMDLLREHMRSVSTADFEYKGSGLISALIGVANRLGRKEESKQSSIE